MGFVMGCGCSCSEQQHSVVETYTCGAIEPKPRIAKAVVKAARVVTRRGNIRHGFRFTGPLAQQALNACQNPRFWGDTGVPFSLTGRGKVIHVGIAEGIGAARAGIGGNSVTMEPDFVGSPWMDNILAHEIGHINWLEHSTIPEDLMSNPVRANDFTTRNDRRRFRQAFRNHGGVLDPS